MNKLLIYDDLTYEMAMKTIWSWKLDNVLDGDLEISIYHPYDENVEENQNVKEYYKWSEDKKNTHLLPTCYSCKIHYSSKPLYLASYVATERTWGDHRFYWLNEVLTCKDCFYSRHPIDLSDSFESLYKDDFDYRCTLDIDYDYRYPDESVNREIESSIMDKSLVCVNGSIETCLRLARLRDNVWSLLPKDIFNLVLKYIVLKWDEDIRYYEETEF